MRCDVISFDPIRSVLSGTPEKSPVSLVFGKAALRNNRQMKKNDLLCLMAAILLSAVIGDQDNDFNTRAAVERAEEIWERVENRPR